MRLLLLQSKDSVYTTAFELLLYVVLTRLRACKAHYIRQFSGCFLKWSSQPVKPTYIQKQVGIGLEQYTVVSAPSPIDNSAE